MTEVLVYTTQSRRDTARTLLGAACAATGISTRLELFGSGSLYQRLGPRHSPPPPDLVMWWGPFAARAAALDGLLQTYQPARMADGAPHDPDWKWTTLDYSPIGIVGSPAITRWDDVAGVQQLAMVDPERSELGMAMLLASLDRERQAGGDVERGWEWWRARAAAGLRLAEDDASTAGLIANGSASHALTISDTAAPLAGIALVPHAVGLAASSRSVDVARHLLDWLVSEPAAAVVSHSPWGTSAPGQLDVAWAQQQYNAVRRRWAASGFGPTA